MSIIKKGIEDHKRGDTWDGVEIKITDQNELGAEVPVDLTGVQVLAQFKVDGKVMFELSTEDDSILIPEPATGEVFFAPINEFDQPENLYLFDVNFKFPDGTNRTIKTHSFEIIN